MEFLLIPLRWMGMVFILAPIFALVPSLFFYYYYVKTKQIFYSFVATLWAIYTLYEYGMKLRILCGGECNIRVDLLLIYPSLILLSIVAIIGIFRLKK